MPSEALLPIGEVARLTGVNPVTLRAWERRYGLIKPQRTAKGHRLYPQDQVQRVQAVLRWLERGAAVSQVRALLDNAADASTPVEGEWGERIEQLIEAIAHLAQRPLDQLLNQAMALYPAVTVCERLLLPLLDALALRWQTHFDAGLEQAFFNTWLRSKLGARVYHDSHSWRGLAYCSHAPTTPPSMPSSGFAPGCSAAVARRWRSSNGPWNPANCAKPSSCCSHARCCSTSADARTSLPSAAPCRT